MGSFKMKTVPALVTGLWLVLSPALSFVAHSDTRQDDASLKSLYDGHRWFELRDSVAKGGAPEFYQGAVACAFHDVPTCAKKLEAVISSRAGSEEAIQAHKLLESAYLREGKYREALVQANAVLALRPGDSDVRDDRPLLAALGEYPDQTIESKRVTTVELEDSGLPFSIHGVQAAYWFDTGAEMSVMSESEAKRFGLRVLAVPVKVGDVNGAQVDSRVAVADELSIGPIRLKHVAFLVLSDDRPPFNEGSPGSRGLIGIPVLLALERFVWHADKKFEIGAESSNKPAPHAELCFDGQHPIARIQVENRSLAFTLDTGATTTDLYPPFAATFSELIRTLAKTESHKTEGVGGAKNVDAATLPSLQLSIGGFPVVLSPAPVMLTPTSETSKFFYGNLGIDLLQQAKKTSFDFVALTLTLQ